jgi:hypothetical protein
MPNGRSGGFFIARRDLKAQFKALPFSEVVGHALTSPLKEQLNSSTSVVTAAAAAQMLDEFSGDQVWIEEQDHKYYIVHLDFGVDVEREPNAARWVIVRSASPLYDSLRKRGKRPFRLFIAALVARLSIR